MSRRGGFGGPRGGPRGKKWNKGPGRGGISSMYDLSYLELGSDFESDFICSPCEKEGKSSEAKCFCVECDENFCQSCLDDHNKFAKMKTHRMLERTLKKTSESLYEPEEAARSYTSLPPEWPTQEVPTPKVELTEPCPYHAGNVINMYCSKHDIVCCTVCIAENHRVCKGVVFVPKKVALEPLKRMDHIKVATVMKKAMEDLQGLQVTRSNVLLTLQSERTKIRQEIQSIRQKINKRLDLLEQKEEEELNSRYMRHEMKIREDIAKIEEKIKALEEKFESMKGRRSDEEHFILIKRSAQLQRECQALMNKIKQQAGNDSFRFVISKELENISSLSNFGFYLSK